MFGDLARPNSLLAFGYAAGNPLAYADETGEAPYEKVNSVTFFNLACMLFNNYCDEVQDPAKLKFHQEMDKKKMEGERVGSAVATGTVVVGPVVTLEMFLMGAGWNVAAQTHEDPVHPKSLDQIDFWQSVQSGGNACLVPPAAKGIAALPAGKAVVGGLVLYFSGQQIGEGGGQVRQGIERNNPGLVSLGIASITSGVGGGLAVRQDLVRSVYPGKNISDAQMQAAIDAIHEAQFGKGKGQGIPFALTVTDDGQVIVSSVDQAPGRAARKKARELLGDDVRFVMGTTRTNAEGPTGNHAEPRGRMAISGGRRGEARQACTHYACDGCCSDQGDHGIRNVTGFAKDHGNRPTRKQQMGTTKIPGPSPLPSAGDVVLGGEAADDDERDR